MSYKLYISGTIHHMIFIYDAPVYDNISKFFFCFFHFFLFFKILIFWVVRGVKGQKIVQNNKFLSVALHISRTIHHLWYIHKCKMMISQVFFHFSKFWFSGLLGGLKRKKWSKMTKKFCLLHSISQEPYTWFSFMVHMCKLIISPGAFFIFSKFLFSRLLGKNDKNSVFCALHIWGTIHHMIVCGTQV